jgi:ATP-dependent RNA helicase RhlE
MKQFSELSLCAEIHHNLSRNRFIEPTPVQAQAIPAALTGTDLVATAQTGTGKTLAFLLPITEKLLKQGETPNQRKQVRALVLSPTRELAIQIANAFFEIARGTQLRAAIVVGGVSEQTQLNALRRGVDLVIATPGRLEDFLNRRLIDLKNVQTLVLDEADRMLDMGFLPAIEKILSATPKERQSLFFSATMDQSIERLIKRNSHNPARISIGSATKTPEQIDLHLYEVEHDRKVGLLRYMLERQEGSFLVFVRTKHGADRLAKRISANTMRAVAMHGDRTQNQRNQALAGFRDGRYRVLVATDVAARGIHVDSVAHVVNFDLPQAPSDFIHRIGRTGRAGQRGTASTFSLKSERGEVKRIERECKIRLTQQPVAPEIAAEERTALPPQVHQQHHNAHANRKDSRLAKTFRSRRSGRMVSSRAATSVSDTL